MNRRFIRTRRLDIQTRSTLHTLFFGPLERFHDSEWGYDPEDEHDRGFTFRWRRTTIDWFPDVGKLITKAMWRTKWADERRLHPGRGMYDLYPRSVGAHMDKIQQSMIGKMLEVSRGGVRFFAPPTFENDEPETVLPSETT